jgi:outer membrane lipoprotein SlyB
MMRNPRLLMSVFLCAALAACASYEPLMSTDGGTLVRTGQVVDVRDVTVSDNRTSGVGSFVGTILGAVAGSTVGGGNGRSLATAGGAVVGNVAGNRMEAAAATRNRTALTVRFENGDTRSYDLDPDPTLRIGQQVQVVTHLGRTTITKR